MYIEGDIPAVVNTGATNNQSGFGNENGAWWIVVFLIFALGGWNNGYGGFGNGGGQGATVNIDSSLQRGFDTASIQSKLNDLGDGLCDGFYAMNTGMLNGFNGVQQSLCQGFNGVNQNIVTNGYETRNAISGLSSQLAQCCCSIEKENLENRYINAQNTCAITNAINMSTRDIVENQNANYRALHEELVAYRIQDKDAKIAEQQATINALNLSASQANQNAYLLSQLRPCPQPAYVVPNPNCCYTYGCGTGCNTIQ